MIYDDIGLVLIRNHLQSSNQHSSNLSSELSIKFLSMIIAQNQKLIP